MDMLYLLIAFVIGGVVGGVIMSLRKSGNEALRIELAKLQSEKEAQADKEVWIENAEEKLREAFDSLAGKSLRHNAEAFLKQAQTQMTGVLNEVRGDWKTQKSEMQNLMSPVRENLDKLDVHVRSLEEDPSLLEYALQSKVLITTPVTLLAFLKAVAYGWQQQAVSENARQIAAVGKELYQRITPFFRHLNTLRRHIDQTVESYNQSIGSLERRILPSVNRLQELDVGDGELDAPQPIDQRTRSLPEASE